MYKATNKRNALTKGQAPHTATPINGGLAVRTNLRAGLAWDDLDDQAAALWDKLTGAVSALTTDSSTTTATQ
jgi:hypothetical protein